MGKPYTNIELVNLLNEHYAGHAADGGSFEIINDTFHDLSTDVDMLYTNGDVFELHTKAKDETFDKFSRFYKYLNAMDYHSYKVITEGHSIPENVKNGLRDAASSLTLAMLTDPLLSMLKAPSGDDRLSPLYYFLQELNESVVNATLGDFDPLKEGCLKSSYLDLVSIRDNRLYYTFSDAEFDKAFESTPDAIAKLKSDSDMLENSIVLPILKAESIRSFQEEVHCSSEKSLTLR